MDTLVRDLRYALRTLSKSPGFALIVIISLGLGIGANTTIYSWVKSILLRPLPGVTEVDRLVMMVERSRSGLIYSTSYPDFLDLRRAVSSKADLVGYNMQTAGLDSGDRTDRMWSESVSAGYFAVLGVEPMLGRGFLPEEDLRPGGAPVVVLSHHLWASRFNSDPGVLGKTVILNSHSLTVVGVAPRDFQGSLVAMSTDLWIPAVLEPEIYSRADLLNQRGHHWLSVFVRPKPGVSVKQAEDALSATMRELSRQYPDTNGGRSLSLVPIWKAPSGATSIFRPVLLVLTLVVGVVLLIACANVANLYLTRSLGRRKEIAIRLAIGGSRSCLVRQLLTESIVLALLGGCAGMLVLHWGNGLLMALRPPANLPIHLSLETDANVLLFALLISILTGMLFGLAPALQASNPRIVSTLKDEVVRLPGAPGHSHVRSLLVIGQVALSLVLLIAAALFLQALNSAENTNPGFDPDHVLAASFDLHPIGYSAERGTAFQRDLLERLRAFPGIESASYVRRLPLGFTGGNSYAMSIEGYEPRPDEEVVIGVNWVGPDYFHTMRTPIIGGRDFGVSDGAAAQHFAVINEAMARRYWAEGNPLGTKLRFDGQECLVVGVVQTGKYHSLNEEPLPYVFLPLSQFYRSDAVLLVRVAGDPGNYVSPVRALVREMDPSLALFNMIRLTDHMSVPLFASRTAASFLALLGFLALALATVGLYSVISYSVAQRTREIGIRVALGAQRRDVLSLVGREALFLTSVGIMLGVMGAAGATLFARNLLYGVSPTDPVTYLGLSSALYLVALSASLLPGYRATRVDPLVALRRE